MKRILAYTTICLLAAFSVAFADTPQESIFKDELIKALTSRDKDALTSMTYFGSATDEWKQKIAGSYTSLFAFGDFPSDSVITFSPIKEQPATIKYKDQELVPSIPLSTLCSIALPDKDGHTNRKTTFSLGEKDGKLWISTLVPKS